MEAVDADVVLRYLVGDNPEQEAAARALMDGLTPSNPGFICREVVLEVAWVLERSYRFPRDRVGEALMDLTRRTASWWRIRMTWPPRRTATAGGHRPVGPDDPRGGRAGGSHTPAHLRPQAHPHERGSLGRELTRRGVAMKRCSSLTLLSAIASIFRTQTPTDGSPRQR